MLSYTPVVEVLNIVQFTFLSQEDPTCVGLFITVYFLIKETTAVDYITTAPYDLPSQTVVNRGSTNYIGCICRSVVITVLNKDEQSEFGMKSDHDQ